MSDEQCALCGCTLLRRAGVYATPTVEGRAHATSHHYVAERFFGRSSNRRGEQREPIFAECPWGLEGLSALFCYECHEELLHNPVFSPDDIKGLAALVRQRNLSEECKSADRTRLSGRIKLLQEVISAGIRRLLEGRNA